MTLCSVSFPRPISYSGGTTIIQNNGPIKNSLLVHYTPHYTYSLGYTWEYFRNDRTTLNGLQLNYLINRWFYDDAQGNLYFKTALGRASQSGITDNYGMASIAADYETDSFFASYEGRIYESSDQIINQFQQVARLGMVPYVGDFNDIHTWLMIEVSHQPGYSGDTVILTPLVRLFQGTRLIEMGYSSDHRLLLNWILRF